MTEWYAMDTLEVLKMFPKSVNDFVEKGDLNTDLYEALYSHWQTEMPYGTQKARDGDPMEWVGDHLQHFYDQRHRHWDTYKFFTQLPRLARTG